MVGFVARRAASAAALLVVISFVIFAALRLAPGDPVLLFVGPYATAEQRAEMRHDLGLDRSVFVQYGMYVQHLAEGDLGRSIFYRSAVTDVIGDAAGPSALLGIAGLALSYLIAIPAGVIAARRHGRPLDHGIRLGTLVGMAIPNFWLALMLSLVFGLYAGWLPVSGWGRPEHLILPAIAVAAEGAAVSTRLVRSSMLETLRLDFVRTLRAQGLPERTVIYRHALRNSLLPSITFFGLRLGWLLAGQVVIEFAFGIPGVGRLMITSILARDYPVVQTLTLLFAAVVILGNLIADVLHGLADPRVRR